MADANDEIKNRLGNEYDLYSSLKDKFQGFDKDGNAVFKDEAGDVTSFSKADFGGMNEQLRKDYGEKSYEETFNKNQFEELAKQGNKFQGFAGDNAIFRNEKGDLENFGSQGGFASFLKKQQPNAAFDISKQGQSQRLKSDYTAGADFLANKEIVKQKTGSGFTGYNPQAALQSLGGKMMTPQPELKSAVNPNILKANNPGGTFQSFKSKRPAPPKQQVQSQQYQEEEYTPAPPPSLGDMAKQMAMQKAGDEFNKLKTQGTNLLEAKKDEAQNAANAAISGATGLSTQMLTNPEAAAKQAALNKAAGMTGLDANLLQGNIAGNIQNLAENKGLEYLKQNDPTGLAQYSNLINGNVLENAKAAALSNAKQQGMDFLKANDPTGGALSGYAQYADLLKGDVAANIKNLAMQKGKEQLMSQAANYIPGAGAFLAPGMSIGKTLTGGGSAEDKGRAAAQAAARATAAYLTGGLATEQNLELADAASNKAFNTVDKNVGSDLKPAVDVARNTAGIGQTLSKGGAKLALDTIGDTGAAQGRAFSDAKDAVKAITSGNIEEGLKGLGSGAAKLALQTFLKNPQTIAKGIGNLGKEAVAKAASAAKAALNAINPFCFAPDTKILMADGTYKKIKQIKLGDQVMLGGKVTAIGQSTSDDMYLYDGVEVSGGHTLYEDGRWIRTKDSKYAVKMDVEEALVYPMDTENHLIVTKGQVWADMSEIDNTYDKTDTDILAELNSQTEANRKIDLFLALYFKQKRK